MGQFYTYDGYNFIAQLMTSTEAPLVYGGTTVNGSINVVMNQIGGLAPGMYVVGAGIPNGTYIIAINTSTNTITLSQAATVSSGGSVNLTFVGSAYTAASLYVHLLQGAIPLSPDTKFPMLTEANYDGYAPQPIQGAPVVQVPQPRNYVALQWGRMRFTPVDYLVQNAISGHCITCTLAGTSTPLIIAMEQYNPSLPIQQEGDIITVNPILSWAFDQLAGVSSWQLG